MAVSCLTAHAINSCFLLVGPDCYGGSYYTRTAVNRTYDIGEKQYISLFQITIFGPIYFCRKTQSSIYSYGIYLCGPLRVFSEYEVHLLGSIYLPIIYCLFFVHAPPHAILRPPIDVFCMCCIAKISATRILYHTTTRDRRVLITRHLA